MINCGDAGTGARDSGGRGSLIRLVLYFERARRTKARIPVISRVKYSRCSDVHRKREVINRKGNRVGETGILRGCISNATTFTSVFLLEDRLSPSEPCTMSLLSLTQHDYWSQQANVRVASIAGLRSREGTMNVLNGERYY